MHIFNSESKKIRYVESVYTYPVYITCTWKSLFISIYLNDGVVG